jgi:hypothetical protein
MMALTNPTVSGYSAFWQVTGDMSPYNLVNNKNSQRGRSALERVIAQWGARNQFRDVAAAFGTLIGAASGTISATYKRAQAPTGPDQTTPVVTDITALGGARNIETVTVINRASTAGDIAYLKDLFDNDLLDRSISYPTVSGSGGGGKLGGF